ncbi:MAG: type II toxin-antitoxin system HicB family antitoxin [Candidatus Gastranaerophilales bacterium]|nr:type II toxin-antitoxin system HicB family antitoxin [Candidatus Gastranaerophilales bacterium]
MDKDINYYIKLPWTFLFKWSDEDNCYVASVAELKGCISDGKTIVEAAKKINEALYSYINCCLAHNDIIPEPVKPSDYKGKIPYRTTPETHYQLAKKSAITGKSINSIIDEAVKASLKESI